MTKVNTKSQSRQRYGLISMLAMIVGMVIGSGIYVKNAAIMNKHMSALAGIIGWLIVIVIVLAATVAFIEISSTTSNTGESGTLSN